MEWLESHPIKDKVGVDFLTAETLRLEQVLLRRARERQALPSDVAGGGSKEGGGSIWRGNVPYLRMIMCFTQNHIKSAFLRRANVQSRTEIDARNSERRYVCCCCVGDSFISYLLTYACLVHRPLTVFELSDLWNDRDFNPIAPSSECHSDYVTSTDCSIARVAHLRPATPQKMLNSFTTMRTELLSYNWQLGEEWTR